MEANVLRIGNLLKHVEESSIVKVASINKECVWVDELPDYHYEIEIELVEPIPLTEEWLLKFGYEKEETAVVDIGWLYDRPDFGAFYKEEDFWLPKPYYFANAFGENFKLKYVHQLQNLYFALTGKELNP